jgi:hypothetical protein
MDEDDFPINVDSELLQNMFDEFDESFEEDMLDFSDDDMWLLKK